jgi:hypothetical protein
VWRAVDTWFGPAAGFKVRVDDHLVEVRKTVTVKRRVAAGTAAVAAVCVFIAAVTVTARALGPVAAMLVAWVLLAPAGYVTVFGVARAVGRGPKRILHRDDAPMVTAVWAVLCDTLNRRGSRTGATVSALIAWAPVLWETAEWAADARAAEQAGCWIVACVARDGIQQFERCAEDALTAAFDVATGPDPADAAYRISRCATAVCSTRTDV